MLSADTRVPERLDVIYRNEWMHRPERVEGIERNQWLARPGLCHVYDVQKAAQSIL
jgi:hypothetical protein